MDLFQQVDLKPGEKPKSVFRWAKSQHWRRIHLNLMTQTENPPDNLKAYRDIRKRLLDRMVQDWDRVHPDRIVERATLICHLVPIDKDTGPMPAGDAFIWAEYVRMP